MTTRALVLAGGGLAGIAWELGVLRGLADVDEALAARVLAADVVIGTSAGSTVAAQITSGTDLDTLYAAQLTAGSSEIDPEVDVPALFERLGAATADAHSPAEVRQAIGAIALASETVSEDARLAAVRSRLPSTEWPERDLRIPAVEAATGDRVVFTPSSGVTLLSAVAASCAVPGVWPPVTIGGTRYVDGGVQSGANADLAAGSDIVLVVTPTVADAPTTLGRSLDDEVVDLGSAAVHVVHADEAAVAAFGTNPLSPGTRAPSAEAGRRLGRHVAAAVAAFWG